MIYRDLSIHQRITAKGNALAFNVHYRRMKDRDLLARVVKRDADLFTPQYPFYNIVFKTNYKEPKS